MKTVRLYAIGLLSIAHDASAFVPARSSTISHQCSSSITTTTTTELEATTTSNGNFGNQVASCAVAAGVVLSSVFGTGISPAEATTVTTTVTTTVASLSDLGGSSQMLAARSGGRAGGRAPMRSAPRSSSSGGGGGGGYSRGSYAPSRSYAPPMQYGRPMVAPIVVSPFGYSPFGYNPFGGFGMGYGLGSMNNIGSEIRDSNQDRRLADEQAELAATKQRAADLEDRIKALERSQGGAPVNAVQPGAVTQ